MRAKIGGRRHEWRGEIGTASSCGLQGGATVASAEEATAGGTDLQAEWRRAVASQGVGTGEISSASQAQVLGFDGRAARLSLARAGDAEPRLGWASLGSLRSGKVEPRHGWASPSSPSQGEAERRPTTARLGLTKGRLGEAAG